MSYRRLTLPKGIKFQPTDEELLNYLHEKNQGTDSDIIPEIESGHEPRDLPALVVTRADFFKEWSKMPDSPVMEYWHYFSRRNFMHSNCKTKSKSTKINRTTKEGSWKKQGDDRRITEAGSDKQIGGKRILTFYLRGKQKTEWVKHEYYPTKAGSDEQIGDFVVCRLQDNSSKKKKSGKSDHDRQDAPLHDGGGDQASIEQGNVLVGPTGNVDAAEQGGSSSSMALNVEDQTDGYISPDSEKVEELHHEPGADYEAETGGSCSMATKFVSQAEENGVSHELGNVVPIPNGNEAGTTVGDMITEEEEYLAYNELGDAVQVSIGNLQEFKGTEQNYHSTSVEDPPDRCIWSDMIDELVGNPGILASLFHQLQQSPMNTTNVEYSASKPLEDVLPMPCGDHDDIEHGGGSSNIASGMETEEYLVFKMQPDALFESDGNEQELRGSQTGSCSIEKSDLKSVSVEGQPDGYDSPDMEMVKEKELLPDPGDLASLHPSPSPEVLQSPIYPVTGTNSFLDDEYRKRKNPFGDTDPVLTKKNHTDEVDSNTSSDSENQAADAIPEGYSQLGGNLGSASFWSFILQSINREPRDLPQDNRYIDWVDLPSIIEGFESFLGNSDTFIDGGTSDRNTEVAYGSVNDSFALAI